MKKKSSFQALIDDTRPVLIDFHADWCGPCKAMHPIVKELAQKMGNQARIVKINVDKNPELAQKLSIRGVPSFLLYQNGQLKWRQSGMLSLHHLETILKQFLNS